MYICFLGAVSCCFPAIYCCLLLFTAAVTVVAAAVSRSSSETTTLGRSSKMCSVVLDATPTKSISRKHAEIVCRKGKGRRGPDKYILRDLVRTNSHDVAAPFMLLTGNVLSMCFESVLRGGLVPRLCRWRQRSIVRPVDARGRKTQPRVCHAPAAGAT